MMEKKLFLGVRKFAVIIMVLLCLQITIFFQNLKNMVPDFHTYGLNIGLSFQVLFLIAILILIPAAIGLYFLKRWARSLGIIGAIILLANLLFIIYDCRDSSVYFTIALIGHFFAITSPFMLYYLTRPKVVRQFMEHQNKGDV